MKLKSVLLTGLIAGTLDLAGACIASSIEYGRFPKKILEYIAQGVFGKEALTGGWTMKLSGLFFHYLIAFLFTLFYFLIYPKINLLRKNLFLSALMYGLFVWAIMNLLVVPNSAIPESMAPFDYIKAAKAALVLIICIGLPVAYFTKKYYDGKIWN